MEQSLDDRLSARVGGVLGLKSGADELTLARADRQRLGAALLRNLAGGRLLAAADVYRVIPRRTWARRKAEGGLTGAEFDALYRLVRLRTLADLVFGGEQRADEWLRAPKAKLGGVAPLDFACEALGHQAVECESRVRSCIATKNSCHSPRSRPLHLDFANAVRSQRAGVRFCEALPAA